MTPSSTFLKNNNNKLLYTAFLCAGFAFANKLEYIPYAVVLFVSLGFIKPSWKQVLLSVVSFLAIPAVCFGVLLIQGVTLADLENAAKLIIGIVKTPSLQHCFYENGMYFNWKWVWTATKIFGVLFLCLIPALTMFYVLNILAEKYKDRLFMKIMFALSTVLLAYIIAFHTYEKLGRHGYLFFSWLGLLCFVILIWQMWLTYNKKVDYSYLFLLIAALSLGIKGFSSYSTGCYGTFAIAVLIMPFVIFGTQYLPDFSQKINKKQWQKTIRNIMLIVILVFVCTDYYQISRENLYPVTGPNGTIYVRGVTANAQGMADFISFNTNPDDRIVSMPEGAMMNFVTGRRSDDKYYYLIPVNTELFGVENIVNDFTKNPPQYFLLNSLMYDCYGKGALCSYAKPLCDFITKYYILECNTDDRLKFYLYKRKT